MNNFPVLTVTVTKTRDGKQDYLDVLSADQQIHIVLIAGKVVVRDQRQGAGK